MIQFLRDQLAANPFILAPMAAITDCPLRRFMKRRGAGLVCSELVSATGLRYSSAKTMELMQFTEDQRPVGIQIFGDNPEDMAYAAQVVEQIGADFVDINFGCPVPKVVKKGAGAGALRDLPRLRAMVRAVVQAVRIPVTIKIRTGWDQDSRNAQQVVEIAEEEGVCWVTIHGRTRAQGYEGRADWNYIAEIKKRSNIPIVGNGDVVTAQQAVQLKESTGCDGIMIGRGALKDPLIFRKAYCLWSGTTPPRQETLCELVDELFRTYSSFYEGRLLEIQFKKLVSWLATGYPNASQLRRQLYSSQDIYSVYEQAVTFFSSVEGINRVNVSNDGFLMGGHG
ncbi:MAG: tRNA dihydrouridine synthase DusB [Bdellovibrionaceae bacterium]|nr:tRNA dihydrouridine synthase DusB [Pseudobdellovibrionaceae bacterium]MDW8190813.1 tRNA dihydrouridine synthase DusB [Pseudobdellovibrionaceae bacterium]